MAMTDFHDNFLFLLRWIHIMAGITWIGHLYFFNFVNVPFQGVLAKEIKPQVNPILLSRALWWFRWGAMITFLAGWLLLLVKYGHGDWALMFDPTDGKMTHRAMWILFGGTLGTIMWFNVWFIIWPIQKQLLTWMKAGTTPPEAAGMAKKALLASRTNTFLSGPMLFGMIAPNNYPSINGVTLIAVVVVAEVIIWGLIKMSAKAGAEL